MHSSALRPLRDTAAVTRWIWVHPSNRGRRLQQLAKAVWFQLRGRLFRVKVQVPLGDRSLLWAELHVSSSARVLYANPPDMPEMAVWKSWLASGDLFIDVGANVGAYSLLAAENGAEVVAVEPDSDSVERLRQNLSLNGYHARIVEAALGSSHGLQAFTQGLDTTNRLLFDGDGAAHREVRVTTLDRLLEGRVARGVKVDVEGAEWIVLRGGENALRQKRIELIQLEWNDCSERFFGYSRQELADWLRSFDYEVVRLSEDGSVSAVDDQCSADVFARPIRHDIAHGPRQQ